MRLGFMLGTLLLLGTAGSRFASTSAHAADSAPESVPAAAEPASSDWVPFVGACLGVLFGAVLAGWQIRGMKRDR
jgi:hypothetical protein